MLGYFTVENVWFPASENIFMPVIKGRSTVGADKVYSTAKQPFSLLPPKSSLETRKI